MGKNEIKVAFLSDLHYALLPNKFCPERRGEFMPSILAKLVKKLNDEVKPDLVICGGDVINFPEAEEAERLTQISAEILSLLDMPHIAIRGNHDLVQEKFTEYFPFHPVYDIDFVRFVIFDDAERPGYNAVRSRSDLLRMEKSAEDFDGVLFSLQHVPLVPAGSCIYGYENSSEILDLMKEKNYRGALSGHFHEGMKLFEQNGIQFLVQSALCESPFAASLLCIDRYGISSVSEI